MRFFLTAFLTLFLLLGCSVNNDQPNDLIPEDSYINLLVELQLLKTYQKQQSPDSIKTDSLRKVIFEKYQTTENQFRKSHKYYQQDIDQQRERIKEAIERLRKDWVSSRDSTDAAKDSAQVN